MSQPSTPGPGTPGADTLSPDTPAPAARPAPPGPAVPSGAGQPGPPVPGGEHSGGQRPGPLAGLVVADFSRVLAGPYCTMLLADLGADVIKVESPAGDDTRRWVPPVTHDGRSTYFLAINRNKRSVVLDLREPGDLAAARELARRADVFVQNFKPGGLARFGLDYGSVSARNPAIIYASISGFGAGGGKDLPGYDLMVQAMSGLMSLTGDPDGPPYRAGISLFDVMAGLHTAIAILAALNHRAATGEGQHIESSLMASALSGMVNQTSAYAAGGVVPFRMGNSHPSLFPYEPLPTADGDLIVTAGNDAQFRKLCEVLGAPGLADDPRFATNAGRTANRDQLRPLLAQRLAARPASAWFDALIGVGVPCGPINTVDGGVAFAREIGLDPVVVAGEGEAGVPTIRHPVIYSATPPSYPLPPPGLDEHGEQIRAWLATAPATPGTGQPGTGQHETGTRP
jgi:crotonobetainyl-CoA:carnitine CoA-transferase CaiB-like acyl-CoA transferase